MTIARYDFAPHHRGHAMNLPEEGARFRATDGTVYVVESFTDLTDEEDFEEGADRYFLELTPEAGLTDISVMNFALTEGEFADFVAEHGLTLA